ncbi:MAG: hypothetical protein JW745_04680 [Sedimentisphaerales bacterium]|nr:hypothetical protein [Sedimentisphaerales bacterium]MBN2842943.1 hypothetical protein [Sedimentisphaerales bacterium]
MYARIILLVVLMIAQLANCQQVDLSGPAQVVSIKLMPDIVYQPIDGVGASLTDSSAWLICKFLTPAERKAVLTELFSCESGIGLSYLRQPMGASDFRLQEYSYNDLPAGVDSDYKLEHFSIAYDEQYIIPALKEIRAINPELKIMASPWSPPRWMKQGGELGRGRLKEDVYETYAGYFVKFIQAYARHDIAIDAITLQNEPFFEPGSYAGCFMSPADQIRLVKLLGPAFATNRISTKILIWDHNWDRPEYPLEVLADPNAAAYIAGTAFHHYGGNVSAQSKVHDKYPGKDIYFTEGSDGTWNDRGFEGDLLANGRFLVETMENWSRTIIKWNLALDENNGPKIPGGCDTCYGVITINQQTREITRRPQYYALGQLSKFLKPGAVRIASQVEVVKACAFANPDGSIVLYVVNDKKAARKLKITSADSKFTAEIPARSIMTFCFGDKTLADAKAYLTTGDKTALFERL